MNTTASHNPRQLLQIITASAIARIALAVVACAQERTPTIPPEDIRAKLGGILTQEAERAEPKDVLVAVNYAPADPPTKQAVMTRIRELRGSTAGYDLIMPNPYGNSLLATIPSNRLYELAGIPEVEFIHSYTFPRPAVRIPTN